MGKEWIVYIVELVKFWLMEKEEKAKVILDYDKYQELLKRVNEADSNTFEVAHKAYYRAVQENQKHINVLKERIAHLEIEKGEYLVPYQHSKSNIHH